VRLFRIFTTAQRALPRIVPLVRDARVPLWFKAGALCAALLIISPLDIFGDIPVLGLLDDAVLLALLVNLFVMVAERWTIRSVAGAVNEVAAKPARIVRRALEP